MVDTPTIIIFIFCLVGCAVSSWFLGKHRGISDAVNYLAQQCMIIVEDEDEDGKGQ